VTITAYLPRLGLLERPVRKPRHRASDEVETLRLKKVWADSLIKTLRVQLDDADARHAEVIARIDERHGEIVRGLEDQIADLERRLQIRTFAEAAAAQTQPIQVITRVLPLHEAPFATANPGRVPSWAVADEPEVDDNELDEDHPDYAPNPPYDLPEGDWQ
jgi:hypothetical protein